MSPYRAADPHPIVTDEIELQAIDWLARKKSRFGARVSGAMMAPTAAAGLLLWPLAIHAQFALFGGKASMSLTVFLAFVVPVTVAFFLSLAVGRRLIRARSSAWLAAAERQFGVPAERLRWGFGDVVPPACPWRV